MRVVLQRTSRAEVRIDAEVVGCIGRGFVLLVGFKQDDVHAQVDWMVEKVVGLRAFPDDEGKMNLSLEDVGGDVLIVSQFTLYGDTTKGRRPSFVRAASPAVAIPLYESFVDALRARCGGKVETGRFGANMAVDLVNDGPVTLLLERS